MGLNWRVGDRFGQNTAKNMDYIKKWFKQKLFRIKFPTKNSVNACFCLPRSGARGL